MKSTTILNFRTIGPVVGAVLAEIGTHDSQRYDAFLTMTDKDDRLATLSVIDGLVNVAIDFQLPDVDDGAIDMTKIMDMRLEITNGKFDRISDPLKTVLDIAGIGNNVHVVLAKKTGGHKLDRYGEPLATRIGRLLETAQITTLSSAQGLTIEDTSSVREDIRKVWSIEGGVVFTGPETSKTVEPSTAETGEPLQRTGTKG